MESYEAIFFQMGGYKIPDVTKQRRIERFLC